MIFGKKVKLRPLLKMDLIKINSWRNSIEIKENALLHPFPVTFENDENWFEKVSVDNSNKQVFFCVETIENNELIGYTQLFNINWVNRNCYFGIIIGESSARGKGFGKEATQLILNYSFTCFNLHKVLLEVSINNEKAINLYKSIGFKQEGELCEQYFLNGKYVNVILMTKINN